MARTGSSTRWTSRTTASPEPTTPSRSNCPTATPRRAGWVVGTSSCTCLAASRACRRARAGDSLTSRPPGLLAHLNITHGCASVPLGVRDDVTTFERRRSLMRHTIELTLAAALVGLAAVACNDGTAPASDQARVLAAEAEQLGAMVDTAKVEHAITFNGIVLVDTSADGVFNPTSRPLAGRMTQQAVLVRDASRPHGWRVVELSPQDWTVVDPSRQTVAVTDVKLYRNDTLLVEVTDPSALFDVTNRIPRFHVGDTIKVVAAVTNTTGSGFTPGSFMFLHVRHATRLSTAWRRVPMVDNGNGTWQRTWIASQTGIDRFIVDALDSATLLLGTADNYRTNEVGIPYRIE